MWLNFEHFFYLTSWSRRVGRTTWRRARARGARAPLRPTGVDNRRYHHRHPRHDHHRNQIGH